MANTEKVPAKGLRANEDGQEYFSDAASVRHGVASLAASLREGKKVLVFSGAGLSTSASIPDYRGPNGVWTRLERGEQVEAIPIDTAVPTLAHRVVATLLEKKMAVGVVSTNIDNLHRRSGVPAERLAELHGNLFLERCTPCRRDFWRPFDVTGGRCRPDHATSSERVCDACGGGLVDSIVHFGEQLAEKEFEKARQLCREADIALVLGTSMRVRPASDLPSSLATMHIVNLQKTPFDRREQTTVTRCRIDLFMHLLARELELEEFAATNVEEGWESVCDAMSRENERKEKEFSKKMLAALVTPQLAAGLRPQQKDEIVAENGQEKREVAPSHPMPILIRNCSNSCFRVTNNCVVKLVLLECTNVSVIVSGRVLTGVCEIINCSGVNLAVLKALPTIQIDNSTNVSIGFVAPGLCGSVVASANCSVSIAPRKDLPPERLVFFGVDSNNDYERSMTQFVTRIQDDVTLLTELVVREGAGYATTQREKDAADAKDAKTEAALVAYLSKMIK